MTLALIMALIFGGIWANDSLKRSNEAWERKKKTITNVELQDYFDKVAFSDIMNDLFKMDKLTSLIGERLLNAIEFLFQLYDVPDKRTKQQKFEDREQYLYEIRYAKKELHYPEDENTIPLPNRIWYNLRPNWNKLPEFPFIKNPHLLYGLPNTTLYIDDPDYKSTNRLIYEMHNNGSSEGFENDFLYNPKTEPPKGKAPLLKYDKCGCAELNGTVPGRLIRRVQGLLVRRDLVINGYHMAYNRKDSYWQEIDKSIRESDKKKEKYPWLYKDIDHDHLLRL